MTDAHPRALAIAAPVSDPSVARSIGARLADAAHALPSARLQARAEAARILAPTGQIHHRPLNLFAPTQDVWVLGI